MTRRILHLSDLHISNNIAAYVAPHLSGLAGAERRSLEQLEFAAAQTKLGPDVHCLVSGDLSAKGEGGQLTLALTYLQQRLQITMRDSSGLGYRPGSLDAVPGNHDVWGGQSPLLCWYASEDKKLQALYFLNIRFPGRWSCSNGSTYIDVGRIRVRAYLLDSTLPGLLNLFARGRISQEELDRLDEMVEQDANYDRGHQVKSCLRIAVLHHPIRSPEGHYIQMILENETEVLRSLRRHEFGMVLCGHEHVQSINMLPTPNWTMYQCIAGSATQTTRSHSPNSFVVYDFQDDATRPMPTCAVTASVYTRSGDPDAQFTPTTEPPVYPSLGAL